MKRIANIFGWIGLVVVLGSAGMYAQTDEQVDTQEEERVTLIDREDILPLEYLYLVGYDISGYVHHGAIRYVLADSSYADVYYYNNDSILFIRTQCAPRCASFVKVYDFDWNTIRTIAPPAEYVLPEAYVSKGQLIWVENYEENEPVE